MKKPGKQQIWLAICCLVSAFVPLQNTDGFEGTEFSGGWLTGPCSQWRILGPFSFCWLLS
jgi:hypothetical protein